jgi:hypothetical protein
MSVWTASAPAEGRCTEGAVPAARGRVFCSRCAGRFRFVPGQVGRTVACPRCGQHHHLIGTDASAAGEVAWARDVPHFTSRRFLESVTRLLAASGMTVRASLAFDDAGEDLSAHVDDPLRGGNFLVRCRRRLVDVGLPAMREFVAVLRERRPVRGIYVTNVRFSNAAVRLADDELIRLVDGDRLRASLLRWGIAKSAPTGDPRPPTGPRAMWLAYAREMAEQVDAVLERDRLVRRAEGEQFTREALMGFFCDGAVLDVEFGNVERIIADCVEVLSSPAATQRSLRAAVERRVQMLREELARIFAHRDRFRTAQVAAGTAPLKDAITNVYDAFLTQLAEYARYGDVQSAHEKLPPFRPRLIGEFADLHAVACRSLATGAAGEADRSGAASRFHDDSNLD